MNIQTFYSNISKQYCPKLSENSSKTIKEFFDTCIEPNLPKKETIIGWDKLLDKRQFSLFENTVVPVTRIGTISEEVFSQNS